ncbi:hypothetical protein K8T06_10440 [bacterium]|nr:hypothetical protein [bacterium]
MYQQGEHHYSEYQQTHIEPPQQVIRKPGFFQTLINPRFRTVTVMTVFLGFIAFIQFTSGMNESVLACALIKPLFVRDNGGV